MEKGATFQNNDYIIFPFPFSQTASQIAEAWREATENVTPSENTEPRTDEPPRKAKSPRPSETVRSSQMAKSPQASKPVQTAPQATSPPSTQTAKSPQTSKLPQTTKSPQTGKLQTVSEEKAERPAVTADDDDEMQIGSQMIKIINGKEDEEEVIDIESVGSEESNKEHQVGDEAACQMMSGRERT